MTEFWILGPSAFAAGVAVGLLWKGTIWPWFSSAAKAEADKVVDDIKKKL